MKSVYGQFCPVAVASEIFAERWTPIILRELVLGSRRIYEIHRGVPRMSRALLAKRLHELMEHGVITSGAGEYALTEAGKTWCAVVVWTRACLSVTFTGAALSTGCRRCVSWCAATSPSCPSGTRRR